MRERGVTEKGIVRDKGGRGSVKGEMGVCEVDRGWFERGSFKRKVRV